MAKKKKKGPPEPSLRDELVFEGRHKEYGAYQNRLYYRQYVRRGLLTSILIFLALIFLPGIIREMLRNHEPAMEISVPVSNSSTKLKIPPKLPEPPASKNAVKQAVADKAISRLLPGKGKVEKDTIAEKLAHDTLDVMKDTALVIDTSGPERPPMFPGGNALIPDFIKTHLQYPWAEKEAGIQGTAIVAFTVNEDGTLDEIETIEQVAIGINHEAERLIGIMPNWWPAKHLNKRVRTRVKIPIEFKMGGSQ